MSLFITVVCLAVAGWASWVVLGWVMLRVVDWLAERRARQERADAAIRRYLPEVVDPVDERFEAAYKSLVGPIPASPLCPPALRRWKEAEAELSADGSFTTAVADVLRHPNQT